MKRTLILLVILLMIGCSSKIENDLDNETVQFSKVILEIPLDILLWQGGAAQLHKPIEEYGKGLDFPTSGFESFKIGIIEHYGDQEDDFWSIALGYFLYYGGYFG